jgi:hypothetical protein
MVDVCFQAKDAILFTSGEVDDISGRSYGAAISPQANYYRLANARTSACSISPQAKLTTFLAPDLSARPPVGGGYEC